MVDRIFAHQVSIGRTGSSYRGNWDRTGQRRRGSRGHRRRRFGICCGRGLAVGIAGLVLILTTGATTAAAPSAATASASSTTTTAATALLVLAGLRLIAFAARRLLRRRLRHFVNLFRWQRDRLRFHHFIPQLLGQRGLTLHLTWIDDVAVWNALRLPLLIVSISTASAAAPASAPPTTSTISIATATAIATACITPAPITPIAARLIVSPLPMILSLLLRGQRLL
jgi:hypothetical protein